MQQPRSNDEYCSSLTTKINYKICKVHNHAMCIPCADMLKEEAAPDTWRCQAIRHSHTFLTWCTSKSIIMTLRTDPSEASRTRCTAKVTSANMHHPPPSCTRKTLRKPYISSHTGKNLELLLFKTYCCSTACTSCASRSLRQAGQISHTKRQFARA